MSKKKKNSTTYKKQEENFEIETQTDIISEEDKIEEKVSSTDAKTPEELEKERLIKQFEEANRRRTKRIDDFNTHRINRGINMF